MEATRANEDEFVDPRGLQTGLWASAPWLREGDQDSVRMGCGRRQRSGAGDNLSGAC